MEGTLGLIATNTIAQGDTRASGLRPICKNGGEIYRSRRRVKWPGLAAVVVSVIHVSKGQYLGTKYIDGQECDEITPFLFHRGSHEDPPPLHANASKSFQGSIVLGMGFTFDDTDKKGVASSLDKMSQLLAVHPHNGDVLYTYIGGDEINSNPAHSHHRYVINFQDYPLCRADLGKRWISSTDVERREWLSRGTVPHDYPDPVAADYSELLTIVESKVKPQRDAQNRQVRRDRWWQFGDRQPALYAAIAGLERVLANSQVSQRVQFAFLPSDMVYSHALNVYPLSTYAAFCALQSRPHEVWAHFFGSSMKDDLRYTPSDCFETFPFPANWQTHPGLEDVGKEYYEFRAALMVRNDEGMTKTYYRFHDPYEDDAEIDKLRRLHAAMDRAVLDAYRWTDIPTDCECLLDYDIDEETWGKKKKPYRYRWPDEIRDEVLARLLELNASRAAEEARAGLTKSKNTIRGKGPRGRPRRAASKAGPSSGTLWDAAP